MITLERVSKRYPDGYVAVDELTLEMPSGETCVLVGPSGCGKTTTLRMINRLIEPSSGRILLDGENVLGLDPVQLRLKMGYVIQQTGLFPHMNVADNVATVPRLWGWDRARTSRRVDELLQLVGLDPARYRRRYPNREAMGTLTFSEIETRPLAPGLILATGKYDLKRTPSGGGDASGRFTLVIRKTAAGWKIIHDHSS